METFNTDEPKIGDLAINLKQYMKVQYDLVELQLIEKTAVSGSELISRIVVVSVYIISILFLSLGFVFFLSQLLHSHILSFLIVGSVYLFIALLFTVFRTRWLVHPLRNKIVKGLTR